VWHRSFTTNQVIYLDLTNAVATTGAGNSFPTLPTDTNFTVGFNGSQNGNGTTYVAYLFAHDAGGFGTAGTDNVISCGTYTGTGSAGNQQTIGFEPQWVLVKPTTGSNSWEILDVMRGMSYSQAFSLKPNSSEAENQDTPGRLTPNATGFNFQGGALNNSEVPYIYIAIRRPMKPPTTGTEVFKPIARTGTGTAFNETSVGFPPDFVWPQGRDIAQETTRYDRLRGPNRGLLFNSDPENTATNRVTAFLMNGFSFGAASVGNTGGQTYIWWNFKRASTFFDVVCYTGTGSNTTQNHNLTVAPELMLVKNRGSGNWQVYSSAIANTEYLVLNSTDAKTTGTTRWNSTSPTSTVFSLGTDATVNNSGGTYVAYLFASAAGVSKVGTYTGTGATQTINCGFTGGARYVLIKSTSTTGNWYVWDSARGIIAGDDPYLLLNSTAVEVTNTDWVDTAASGFELSNAVGNLANSNGVSYIFLAIA
jgi:hypothetical protein